MVGPDGQVRILDFGIGCLLAETEGESLVDTMSTANSVNSGLDCASPESIMDPTNLTAIGDQYSLGCVMYYCLTGQYPFPDGTAVEKMMGAPAQAAAGGQGLTPDAPDGLVAVVERLMQKTPASRYSGCAEVIEALRPFAPASGPVRTRPTMTIPRLRASQATAAAEDAAARPTAPGRPAAAAPRRRPPRNCGPPPPSGRRPRRRRPRPPRRTPSRSRPRSRRPRKRPPRQNRSASAWALSASCCWPCSPAPWPGWCATSSCPSDRRFAFVRS